MIQSPLNYTGGKFKLLPQILPLFPQHTDRFFDLFCGGCNVAINIESDEIICSDINRNLIYLYQTFQNLDKEIIFKWIYEIIEEYGLSLASKNGYKYYNSESDKGLGEYNKKPFKALRDAFNNCQNIDYRYYVMLYVIIIYSFNNQIRFNSSGQFNLPVGKRDFNERMQFKLSNFIDKIKSNKFKFICKDFRNFDINNFSSNDFLYIDPPYLITCASYNENNGWNNNDERDLLSFLDIINDKNIKFALSNVLTGKGNENKILNEWLNKNKDKYKIFHLKKSYANSNYHKTNKINDSDEVLIVNYEVKQRQGDNIELEFNV